jgi:uncharacterized protein (TIGR00251 family)
MNWLAAAHDQAGVLLTVHVQPKASRTAVVGEHGEALKIAVAAPPLDNRANEALVKFLAKLFRLPKTAVQLESGERGRHKRFLLTGITIPQASEILRPLLTP